MGDAQSPGMINFDALMQERIAHASTGRSSTRSKPRSRPTSRSTFSSRAARQAIRRVRRPRTGTSSTTRVTSRWRCVFPNRICFAFRCRCISVSAWCWRAFPPDARWSSRARHSIPPRHSPPSTMSAARRADDVHRRAGSPRHREIRPQPVEHGHHGGLAVFARSLDHASQRNHDCIRNDGDQPGIGSRVRRPIRWASARRPLGASSRIWR